MALIYHMVLVTRWQSWPSETPYLPAEYDNDGFVHCTAGDALMLKVANHFYTTVPGDFGLLVIDTERLTSPLKWESPTPGDTLAPLFPHIYGPINHDAIVAVRSMRRTPDGQFIEIGG
ncbi:MAG: DUF952 domain-containing protein [Chloroflexi bacterium]|nr:DUF952 domain-containing protein [Chloroflexota bacterium]